MAHLFNSEDYRFNTGEGESNNTSSGSAKEVAAKVAGERTAKVRTFKDYLRHSADTSPLSSPDMPQATKPTDTIQSSKIITGGGKISSGKSAIDQRSTSKASAAMSGIADNAKENATRAADSIKRFSSAATGAFSFDEETGKGGSDDNGSNPLKGVSDKAKESAEKARSASQRMAAAVRASVYRFNDRSNRFSDSVSKFNKASRFDDKSGRFNEVFEKDDFKAKPEKADIAKAVTAKNIESFISDKDNAKSDSKALTAEQRKNKYADRFIDPEQPKKQTQIAIAGSKTVAAERQKAKLEPEKKKFAAKSGKNARLNVAGNAGKNGGNGKDLPKKKDKGLLKKVAKMRVIKAISSGELTMNSDGSLENGVRRISGNGVAGKVGSAVKRIGDAIKATVKALIKVVSFIIRHPIITLFIIIIILVVVVVLIICDAITTHWGGAQAEQEKNTAVIATVTTPFSKNTSYKGDDIVQYALQFVGNAYCIGGDNINGHIPGEDGIDCSHFVYRVLQETGHYDGGYVTSKLWANLGEKVSLNDLQPGDVASFDGEPYGHVVIIVENLGGGKCEIVHAKGKNYGIIDEVVEDITLIHGRGNLLGFSRFTKQNTYT